MGKYDFFDSDVFGVHSKIVDYIGFNKKVLDVGCAEGNISEKLHSHECEVIGIEIDEKSAQTAKQYCNAVIIGDVESVKLTEGYANYFDIILFADVLEHLKEPSNVLKRFKYYLKDDGYIIISIPNIANWRMRIKLLFGNFDYEDYGLLDKTHLRFYNFKGMKKLLSDADLEIVNFDIALNGIKKFPKFFYSVSVMWPNLLAYQFLITAKKK
jgi:O-antigen biosynthesis protein